MLRLAAPPQKKTKPENSWDRNGVEGRGKGEGHLASFPLLYTSELLMFPIQPSKFNKVWRMLSDPKLEYRKKLTVYPRSSHTKGIHTDKNLSKSLLNVVF